MITAMISRLMILAFGTLYPAYASYKAVRTKDVKEYVKWMMYWIVFALFTCAETFTDVFFSFWFPFYYEIKVALVFWLLSPATKGSSFLYRNFVHPALQRRESEIDEMLSHAKEKGYNTVLSIGSRSVTYATNVLLQTAMRGGGGLVEQIKKSYSLTDLAPKIPTPSDTTDLAGGRTKSILSMCLELMGITKRNDENYKMMMLAVNPNLVDPLNQSLDTRQTRGRRGIAGSAANLDMRFSEVDVNIRQCPPNDLLSDIRSSEDISSGYSSTDQLYTEGVLTRSSSVSSTRARGRGGRTAQTRRAPLTEDSEGSDDDSENISNSFPKNVPNKIEPSNPSQSESLSNKLTDSKNTENQSAIFTNNQSLSTNISEETTNSNVFDSESEYLESTDNIEQMENVIKKEEENFTEAVNLIKTETETEIVQLNTEFETNLNKCSSEISVSSISSCNSNDLERKGKYKKLPAPRPPSQIIDLKELPELEKKLSETEALMKKIDSVNLQEINEETLQSEPLTSEEKATNKEKPLKLYSSTMV